MSHSIISNAVYAFAGLVHQSRDISLLSTIKKKLKKKKVRTSGRQRIHFTFCAQHEICKRVHCNLEFNYSYRTILSFYVKRKHVFPHGAFEMNFAKCLLFLLSF